MQDSTLCPSQYLHAPLLRRRTLCRVSHQPGKYGVNVIVILLIIFITSAWIDQTRLSEVYENIVVVFFTLTDRASTIPSNIHYVVANPLRGLLDRKRSEEHLSSSNAKEKHKHTKNDKEKGTGITKYTGQTKIDEGHSIERV